MSRPVKRGLAPSGRDLDLIDPPTAEELAVLRKQYLEERREAKAARREHYENAVSEQLGHIAALQAMVIQITSDTENLLSPAQMSQFALGLKASEQVLNRALGKPVSHVEATHTHTIAEAMATADDDWIVEDAEIVE